MLSPSFLFLGHVFFDEGWMSMVRSVSTMTSLLKWRNKHAKHPLLSYTLTPFAYPNNDHQTVALNSGIFNHSLNTIDHSECHRTKHSSCIKNTGQSPCLSFFIAVWPTELIQHFIFGINHHRQFFVSTFPLTCWPAYPPTYSSDNLWQSFFFPQMWQV